MHVAHLADFDRPGPPVPGRLRDAIRRVVHRPPPAARASHPSGATAPRRRSRARPAARPVEQGRLREFLDEVLAAGIERFDLD